MGAFITHLAEEIFLRAPMESNPAREPTGGGGGGGAHCHAIPTQEFMKGGLGWDHPPKDATTNGRRVWGVAGGGPTAQHFESAFLSSFRICFNFFLFGTLKFPRAISPSIPVTFEFGKLGRRVGSLRIGGVRLDCPCFGSWFPMAPHTHTFLSLLTLAGH